MPYCTSGVTFVLMIVPNGEAIPSPPAYGRPPIGAVWHAAQSPTLARYSPRAMSDVLGDAICALDVALAEMTHAMKTSRMLVDGAQR
jgi:hypothetical protein